MSFLKIGNVSDFPEGAAVAVRVGARRIAVYRVDDEFFAIKNICPHEANPLHNAPPDGGAAVCRAHGWRFDLRTGQCLRGDRDSRVAVYPVKIDGDEVLVNFDRGSS